MSINKNTQIEILKYILRRTRNANKKLEMLDERLRSIIEKMNHPVDGISYKQMPGGNGNNDGAAEIPLRADELESKIKCQRNILAECMLQGLNILDELDAASDEYAILSAYYIGGQRYEEISERLGWDISTVWRKMRIGYEKLIQVSRIQELIVATEDEWRRNL